MSYGWRPGSESNRRTRLCRPLHDHSATWPSVGSRAIVRCRHDRDDVLSLFVASGSAILAIERSPAVYGVTVKNKNPGRPEVSW